MIRGGVLVDAGRSQNSDAFAVRPDLFTLENLEDLGGGCVRLVRFVDLPGGSWEVVYTEEFGPVVIVTAVTPAHDDYIGRESGTPHEFDNVGRALSLWESWEPADVPLVCSGCGVSVAPGSGVGVNVAWANMTGNLMCKGCIAGGAE
jgi:hypothetical protein